MVLGFGVWVLLCTQTEAALGLMRFAKKARDESSRLYHIMPKHGVFTYVSTLDDEISSSVRMGRDWGVVLVAAVRCWLAARGFVANAWLRADPCCAVPRSQFDDDTLAAHGTAEKHARRVDQEWRTYASSIRRYVVHSLVLTSAGDVFSVPRTRRHCCCLGVTTLCSVLQ